VTYSSLAREAVEKLHESAGDSFQARLLVAESLEERGWFRDAADSYRRLLEQHPEQPGLRTALGFCILLQDESSDVDAALAEFQEDLNDHPGYLLARLGRARVALELRKPKNALKELCDLWVADSDFVRLNVSRLLTGLQPERLDDLGRLLKEGPTNGTEDALFSFFIGALQAWNAQLNAPAFSVAPDEADGPLRSPPSGSRALDRAGAQELLLQGHYTECATNLRPRMLQLSSADLELFAECSYNRGDYQTAFLAGKQLVKLLPYSPAALFWQARTSRELAVATLTKAGEVEPNSPRMLYLVAEGYRENKSYKEAEAAYLKTLELQPKLIAARLGLASIYMATAEPEKARVQLEKALEQNPADREAAYMLGDVLVTMHRYAEAMSYLNSTQQSPFVDAAHIHMLRSKVYLAEGKAAEALVEVEIALPADLDGSYHYQLAQIYKQLGDSKLSAAALEQSENIRNAHQAKRGLTHWNSPVPTNREPEGKSPVKAP
jgi:tetratricopeptide (TPR) repeat protein